MDKTTGSEVLYYPHIEIADTELLKGALCIWDSVYRIVPEGCPTDDSTEVKEAINEGALKDIRLSTDDLKEAREHYQLFIEGVPMIPDAIDRQTDGNTLLHQGKLDEVMLSELSDLIGTVARQGDWFKLPRGVADGYMLFLSDVVARRRGLPKVADSVAMFVAMQYFAMDGNMDEWGRGAFEGDIDTALVLRYLAPAGIDDEPMSKVLKFRKANTEGRQAFRRAVDELAKQLSQVQEDAFAREVIGNFIRHLQESERITLSHIREYFSQPETLCLGLGVPLAAQIYHSLTGSSGKETTLAAISFSGIWALADVLKSCRKDWVPAEATYLANMRGCLGGNNPFPAPMFNKMMDEFMND